MGRSRRQFRAFLFCLMLGGLTAPTATTEAGSISLAASAASVDIGATLEIRLTIDGLSAPGESLAAFDVDVLFDPLFLQFEGYSFVDTISGINQLDLPEVGGLPFVGDTQLRGPGVVDSFGLTGNSAAVLDLLQADSFDVVRLVFRGLARGQAAVSLDVGDSLLTFADPSGAELVRTNGTTSLSVPVVGAPVSVPDTPNTLLLMLAPVGLLIRRSYVRG